MSARRKPPAPPPTDGTKPDLRIVANSGQVADEEEGPSDGLSARELVFVESLASGKPVSEASAAVNISARSARRWKTKPAIVEAIRTRLAENTATGHAILAAGMARAARSLVDMSDGAADAEAARVSAARAVVEGAVKLGEIAEIEARLAELEATTKRGAKS